MVYALVRLALGGVRLDPTFLFGLQIEQVLALGVLAFGLWYAAQPCWARGGAARRRWRQAAPGAGQGGLSRCMTVRVTLYTKPGCHLCEEAEAELKRLERRYPHTLTLVDITPG